jgi:hypothetical protein
VIQRPTDADSIDDCDSRTAHTLSTDGHGHFSTKMFVSRVITDGHAQETDCRVADSYVVASVYIHRFQRLATTPLHFASRSSRQRHHRRDALGRARSA